MKHDLRDVFGEDMIFAQDAMVPDQVVKSAGRVFQILEMFDTLRREALVSEISAFLGLPQSSTSVLLRSMMALGYMSFNRETRAYYPTTKVAMLGSWINSPLVCDGALLKLAQRLNERTEQAIMISMRNQICVEYIHAIQAKSHARLYMVKGIRRSVIHSACGLSLIAHQPDAEIKRMAMRINADTSRGGEVISLGCVMGKIERAREKGYVLQADPDIPKVSVLAMPLPTANWSDRFAVALGASTSYLQQHEEDLAMIMREEIAAYEGATVERSAQNLAVN